jgi:hypothetical protein
MMEHLFSPSIPGLENNKHIKLVSIQDIWLHNLRRRH